MSLFAVLKSFIKNLMTTKSRDINAHIIANEKHHSVNIFQLNVMAHKNSRICNHFLPAILTALANVQFRGCVTAVTVTETK